MTERAADAAESPTDTFWKRAAIGLILAFTLARIVAIALSPIELYADESQYWVWSWTLDWGYFSKPPMIAWLIALSTSLLGETDFAIRLPSPLLHAATASFLCLTAARLWSARAGFFAAAIYLTLPAVWVAGGVISTDSLLLAGWSAGLYAMARLRGGEGGLVSALGLGAAIGFGFMSKYAMIYFIIATGLSLLVDAPARRALLSRNGLAAGGVAALIIAPNIAWNAANDFATVSHTAANAAWGADMFHPGEMAEFVLAQLAVFGPVLFPVLVVICALAVRRFWRERAGDDEIWLSLFVMPPILAVTVQAFLSRAHANWAASAYVAGCLLVIAFLLRGPSWRRIALAASIALHSAFGLFAATLAASPDITSALGRDNDFKRIRGWRDTAAAIAEAASGGDYAGVVFDDRNVFHQMQRYGDAIGPDLFMWRRFAHAHNHADQTWPLPERFDGVVLVVSERPLDTPRIAEDFEHFEPAGEISIPLGGDISRDFTLWRASGHQRVERDASYEERWAEIDRQARAGSP